MIKFVKGLLYGEPAYFFGVINTVIVALATQFEWAGIAALVSVPLSAFIVRRNVSPINGS